MKQEQEPEGSSCGASRPSARAAWVKSVVWTEELLQQVQSCVLDPQSPVTSWGLRLLVEREGHQLQLYASTPRPIRVAGLVDFTFHKDELWWAIIVPRLANRYGLSGQALGTMGEAAELLKALTQLKRP